MDHQLLETIDEQKCLAFLAQMVKHKSYSATPGETELAKFMVAQMMSIGLDAKLHKVDTDRYQALGTLKGTGGGASLLFNGHLDTNPATEGWTVDPWGGLIDDKFIYGIGVSNMKAGDAAYFCAVKALLDAGIKLRGDVILTYVVGELQGGIGTVKAIEDGVRADYFINSEPTDLQALTMHSGAFVFAIELTGITRHMSNRNEAVDAIVAACELVPTINAISFSGALNKEHESVNRANIGVIRGALSPEFHDWRAPQVADFVRLLGSARYAPSQSEASVLEELRSALDDLETRYPGLKTKVFKHQAEEKPSMLPFEVSRESRLVKTLNKSYKLVRGESQPTGPIPPACFFGTDAAHFQHRLGMEGIVCGPGGRYNTMPDERVDIPDYLDMIKIYMLAILEICEVV